MITANDSEAKIWYREPWFWILISPLIVVVIVSTILVTVALSGSDDVVSDNYYKEGRMLSQEFTSEEYAQSIGLAGKLDFDLETQELLLELNQSVDVSKLHVYLSHPISADRDMRFPVRKTHGSRYRAALPTAIDGRWYIRVTSKNDASEAGNNASRNNVSKNGEQELWRLVGEIDLTRQTTVSLQ